MVDRASSSWKGLPTLLKQARKRAGVTPVRAAKTLGIRRAAIWEMENGKRKVSAAELVQLAKLYGVSETWLMHRASSRARDDRAELAAQVLAGLTDPQLERLLDAIRIIREPRSPMLNMSRSNESRERTARVGTTFELDASRFLSHFGPHDLRVAQRAERGDPSRCMNS